MILSARPLVSAVLAVTAGLGLSAPVVADVPTVRMLCEAVYLPARTVWVREVTLELSDRALTGVRIDGVPVYTFAVAGTLIMTALDNERIRIDVARQTWQSDFRGEARGQGRCERDS